MPEVRIVWELLLEQQRETEPRGARMETEPPEELGLGDEVSIN